ncbi:MAG: nucleotidyltransferase family protein [Bacteroidales bacterium]|nr:nucleotidyltransferase family protein [Bacteroidales bacterium]
MNKDVKIRVEEILLIGLSRLTFSKELALKIQDLIMAVTDWEYFISLANEHGIAALVFHNLENLGSLPLLPGNCVKSLRNFLMLSISRNAFHKTALEESLGLLNRAGIKVVLLKGFALEMTVYGDAGLRQMTDVDILIDRLDCIKARRILMTGGYDSLPVKSGFHKPIMAWTGKHLPSLLKNGVSVDIHLELFAGKRNDLTKQLYTTSKEIRIDRETAFIPAPQLFFLYLVKHLNHHEIRHESQLRLYVDLVALIEKYKEEIINYDLLSNALKAGMSKILARRLEPLRDLWEIPFPDWVDDFINRWFSPDSINKFVFFLKSPKNNKLDRPGHAYRTTLKEIPCIHRKILFILGDIFPTISFMKERYKCKSRWKALFHYPIRLGKLLYLFKK